MARVGPLRHRKKNYSAPQEKKITLLYYLHLTSLTEAFFVLNNTVFPVYRSLSLLETVLQRMTYRPSNKISNPLPKIGIYFNKTKYYRYINFPRFRV